MVPGHAIESMWFLIHIYLPANNRKRILEAAEVVRWALERGRDDDEYVGLYLGIDIEGFQAPLCKHADTRIWWVLARALYAVSLCYELTREGSASFATGAYSMRHGIFSPGG